MRTEQSGSKSARIVYRPFGLAGSILGGLVASAIFKQVWQRAAPGDQEDAPGALQTEYPLKEIFLAAAIQGAIYGAVKAGIDRGGARLYEKWSGDWPGD